MLKKAKFKVEFEVSNCRKYSKTEECLALPYRTEECYNHVSSLVYRCALTELIKTLEDTLITIKKISLLAEYEEVKEENRPSVRKN